MSVLKSGSKGNDVRKLRTGLNKLGATPKLKVDGIFGPKTLEAVKTFQKKAELKRDGQVGKLTLGAIRAGGTARNGRARLQGQADPRAGVQGA